MTRRALVCAPLLPEFDRESGSQRIFDTVRYLLDGGWSVTFVAENPHGDLRYVHLLEQRGVAVYRGFDERTDLLFAHGRFDVAVFSFFYLYEAHAERLRAASPSTRIVVDSIDLHFLRNARRLLQPPLDGSTAGLDEDYGIELARELSVYAAADAVLTVSPKEADLVNDFLGRPGHALPVPDAEERPASRVPLRQREGVLFVGNFRHPPNLQAAEYLCTQVVPRVDPALLRAHPVSLVGNALPDALADLAAASGGLVRAVGWVPSLTPYLERTRVSLLPLLYGAGTKRKLIQSLMVGIPTVTTSVGVEGLDVTDGRHLVVTDDPDEMASAVTRLLTDDRAWTRLSKAGAERVRQLHGTEEARRALLAAVERTLRAPARPAAIGMPTAGDYRTLVRGVRQQVDALVPRQAKVAVISRGDEALVSFPDRTGCHFPSTADGRYAGHYPADGADALRQLTRARDGGARYLVVPRTAQWWLEHYQELGAFLAASSSRLVSDDVCAIYDLQPASSRATTAAGSRP